MTPPAERSAGSRAPTHPIVIDDIGLLPVANETAEALCRVVDAACERRSRPQLPTYTHPASRKLMPKTIAHAAVDRLLHQAHTALTAATPSGSPKQPAARE